MEKREILYSLAPFSNGVKTAKRKMDLADFAFSDARLYGSALTKEGVQRILEGEAVPGAPVFEHRLCEAHRKLLARFADNIDMSLEIDIVVLNDFCTILSGSNLPPYREGSPLLYHLDFVPGDEDCISADLSAMFAAVRHEGTKGDFCLKAAALHMGIVKVYPYSEGLSELSARAAMQYELVKAGYFPVDIGITETDYNKITANSIKSGNAGEFADILRTAVLKKLYYLIDLVNRGV
jgi:hypothetical protein